MTIGFSTIFGFLVNFQFYTQFGLRILNTLLEGISHTLKILSKKVSTDQGSRKDTHPLNLKCASTKRLCLSPTVRNRIKEAKGICSFVILST